MSRIRVLLADHNDDFLEGVSDWLTSASGLELVGTTSSGREAVYEVERLQPDLVLMDVALDEVNGFEATRQIKSEPEAPQVILLTFHESASARAAARDAGADGFVAKTKVTEDLMRVIRDLLP